MRHWISVVLLALALCGQGLQAAGTVTWPVAPATPTTGLRAYTVTLTSDNTGVVTGNAHGVLSGQVVSVRVAPGVSGVQPSDNFDLRVVYNGLDLLNGQGANLDNATSTLIDVGVWLDSASPRLDLVVGGAGNAKQITVTLLIRVS
jgi:hypothetical protein